MKRKLEMKICGQENRVPPPPPEGVCAQLVYQLTRDCKNQTFCWKVFSALHDKKVLCSSYEWLVLYDCSTNLLSLCNSTTFDYVIPLPSLDQFIDYNKIESCALFSPSSDPNNKSSLKVLLFLANVQSVMWCRVGDEEWGIIKYGEKLLSLRRCDFNSAFLSRVVIVHGDKICARDKICAGVCGGGRYWHEGYCSVEIIEEPFFGFGSMCRYTHADVEEAGVCASDINGPFTDVYVVESCGELFMVGFKWGDMKSIETLEVEVWRWFSTPSSHGWVPVKRLKDKVFFLGKRYSFCCNAPGSGHIYFTTKTKGDKSIYCYSIEEDSILLSSPCPNLLTPWLFSTMSDVLAHESGGGNVLARESGGGRRKMLDFGLENDVLEEITKRLCTPLDYMNFRCVSRRCQSIAPLANWRTLSTPSSSQEKSYGFPLLVSVVNHGPATDEKLMYKFVDPRQNNIYYMMTIPESHKGTLIVYSNRGWLLTTRCDRFVNLYNPFTKSILNYPVKRVLELNENFFFVQSGDAAFMVASISFFYRNKVVVISIRHGEERWTRNELHSNVSFSATHTTPVLFRGSFYYLDHNGNIGKLKIKENNTISWKVLHNPRKPFRTFYPNFLVECGGELLSVCIQCGGESVVVCMFNHLEKAWETTMNLGNYSLYLSRSSSFSVPVMSPELRNRIYLPLFCGSEFVFFSLDSGKWHFPASGDSSNHFYGSRYHLNASWIQPSWC